ncbi:MAG: lipase family protein [Siculibacillus sp.]|nr:lipase family protein [Siculibacillus sp.]
MPTLLTPAEAAALAQGVYDVRNNDLARALQIGRRQPGLGTTGLFDAAGGTRLVGTSGNAWSSANTGFGYVASGVGAHSGECLVAFRGTEFSSTQDWLSNINMPLTPSAGGHPVHQGFMGVYSSLAVSMRERVMATRPTCVHIVGHSLGGAIASLAADDLILRGLPVKLYTFGAPRVGLSAFARHLSDALGSDGLFRVSHVNDPVPMLPVFPFLHAPVDGVGILLRGPGERITVDAHDMTAYIASLGNVGWSAQPIVRADFTSLEAAEAWLRASASGGNGIHTLSAGSLWLAVAALRRILNATGRILGIEVLGAATAVDRISAILHAGVQAVQAIAEAVGDFVRVVMRVAGLVAETAVDLTRAFLGWILRMMFNMIAGFARRAVDRLV